MAKANAIQNQKVFVSLTGVLTLQDQMRRAVEQVKAAMPTGGTGFATGRQYAQGLAAAIRALDLPIDIPQGF